MIIFLIGVNDMGKVDFAKEDGFLIERRESFFVKTIKKSELANLLNNLYLSFKTKRINLRHGSEKKQNDIPGNISEEDKAKFFQDYRQNLPQYKERVELLAGKCLKNQIIPVFITQPLLGKTIRWETMELYNGITKQVCSENKILCIDLAHELEKDQKYFYDNMHYTNAGSERVSELICRHISDFFEENKGN